MTVPRQHKTQNNWVRKHCSATESDCMASTYHRDGQSQLQNEPGISTTKHINDYLKDHSLFIVANESPSHAKVSGEQEISERWRKNNTTLGSIKQSIEKEMPRIHTSEFSKQKRYKSIT